MNPSDVGTKVLFEDETVRIWEIALEPGEAVQWHVHYQDYTYVYVTEDNLLETTLAPDATTRPPP